MDKLADAKLPNATVVYEPQWYGTERRSLDGKLHQDGVEIPRWKISCAEIDRAGMKKLESVYREAVRSRGIALDLESERHASMFVHITDWRSSGPDASGCYSLTFVAEKVSE